MSLLFINENNATIGIESNRCFIKYSDGMKKTVPIETLEGITIMGHAQMTTQCVQECFKRGIPVVYYSKGGSYFGFMHKDKENHPTLASDMMEEWRAVIVDSTVMSMINGHEIQKEDFTTDIDAPGCFLTKNGIKIFLSKLEKKLQTEVKYLSYVNYPVSFRRGIALQIESLVKAIETQDASIYKPIEIR